MSHDVTTWAPNHQYPVVIKVEENEKCHNGTSISR